MNIRLTLCQFETLAQRTDILICHQTKQRDGGDPLIIYFPGVF